MPEKETKTSKDKEKETEKPIDKMTVVELREIAKEIEGVTGVHAMKKDQLLALVKEHRGIADEEPKKKKPKKPAKAEKVQLGARELKEKAANLRQEKEAARQVKDRAKVKILQRRINRLKKMSRKVAQG